MDIPWFVYAAFLAFVVGMLFLDLKVFHKEAHEPSTKESAVWVVVWIGLGLAFGVGVWTWLGPEAGGEYYAGFLIEKALSVDNMFVFILIFNYFRIPFSLQHQVLFYGILGALVFRGIFIALGVALIQNFSWVIYVFGAFLIFTAYRITRGTEEVHPEDNPILKWATKRFRSTTRFDGQKLFTIENGVRVATPLFVCLLFIEITDIVFAIDSIPAIFGITHDPFIVLTSNVFAILGLRALYFLLAGAIERFHLLHYGLGVILGFVGVKMIATAFSCSGETFFCHEGHVSIPIWASLLFILGALIVTVVLSLKTEPAKHLAVQPGPPGSSPTEVRPSNDD